jgi:hypothetical protein
LRPCLASFGKPINSTRRPVQTDRISHLDHLLTQYGPAETRKRRWQIDHPQDRLAPLLSHAYFPHVRECDQLVEVAETYQPKLSDPSAEGILGRFSRTSTSRMWTLLDSNQRPADNEPDRSASTGVSGRLIRIQNHGPRRSLALGVLTRSDGSAVKSAVKCGPRFP